MKTRRNHRYTAIVGALFTLAWSFSGTYHAFAKFKKDDRDAFFISNHFTNGVDLDLARMQAIINKPISNCSLVKMEEQTWWRVIRMDTAVTFINANDYALLPKGEEKYAAWLATQFSHHTTATIRSVTPVTKFNDEYNFSDKRLPVWRVSYAGNNNERYFVETATGKLSVRVDDGELREGYSFAMFHKHHFMDWGGKTARDASTMFWAFFQVMMIVVGLVLWWTKRAK